MAKDGYLCRNIERYRKWNMRCWVASGVRDIVREIFGCAAFALNIKCNCWRNTQVMSIDEWNRHCCCNGVRYGVAEVLSEDGR